MNNDDALPGLHAHDTQQLLVPSKPGFFALLIPAILAAAASVVVLNLTHPAFGLPEELVGADVQAGPGENPELRKAVRVATLKNAALVLSYTGLFLTLAYWLGVRKCSPSFVSKKGRLVINLVLSCVLGAIGGHAGQLLLTHFGDTQTRMSLVDLILGHSITLSSLGIVAGVSVAFASGCSAIRAVAGGVLGGIASAILYVVGVSLAAPTVFPEMLIDLSMAGQVYWFTAMPIGITTGIGCLLHVGGQSGNQNVKIGSVTV
ncbi:MAG: hypothetical protein R3C59_20210 [Planctomycetaceae bacterium]